MPEQREEWITNRAHELWEQAGMPDGQDQEHWSQASNEWENRRPLTTPVENSPATWDEEQ